MDLKKGEIVNIIPNNSLSELIIEISGRDALSVAASLDLGGLAVKHVGYKRKGYTDSSIMENAIRKLDNK